MPVTEVRSGQTASFALKKIKRSQVCSHFFYIRFDLILTFVRGWGKHERIFAFIFQLHSDNYNYGCSMFVSFTNPDFFKVCIYFKLWIQVVTFYLLEKFTLKNNFGTYSNITNHSCSIHRLENCFIIALIHFFNKVPKFIIYT